jgi:membrane-bound lytic murein transglycosylase D
MKQLMLTFSLLVATLIGFAQNYNPRYKSTEPQIASELQNERSTNTQLLQVGVPRTPKSFTLFGEKMPLDTWDVRERFDREILVNTFMQSATSYIIKLMNRWLPMIEQRLAANGVPDDFKYLAIAESALQNQTSRVGAVGFWQFMPSTAPSYGLYIDGEVDERYNAEKATDAACKYLKEAYNKFGNWTSAAASYNCGMGGMNNALNSQGESSFYDVLLPEETMRYVFRIAALKFILSNPKAAGFNLGNEDVYKQLKVKRETISGGVGSLISYAKSKGTNYKTVRMLNPWLREKTFNNAKGRTYTILLPSE